MTHRALSVMELQRLHRKLAGELGFVRPLQKGIAAAARNENADWRRAMGTACERFGKNDVKPDGETIRAAAWLEIQLEQGLFPRPGISESAARSLLESVYRGTLIARIQDGGRVVLRETLDGQQERPVVLNGRRGQLPRRKSPPDSVAADANTFAQCELPFVHAAQEEEVVDHSRTRSGSERHATRLRRAAQVHRSSGALSSSAEAVRTKPEGSRR